MKANRKNNNDTKIAVLMKRLIKYVEENRKYFESADAVWTGRIYGRY